MRTNTTTKTITATRTRLLEANVEVAVRRLMNDSDRLVERIVEIGVRQQLIQSVTFRGQDKRHVCFAALTIDIDWDEHERQSSINGRLRVNGKALSQGSPELRSLLSAFEDAVSERKLRVVLSVRTRDGIDKKRVERALGLVKEQPWRWANRPSQTAYPLHTLSEMSVALELSDDDPAAD